MLHHRRVGAADVYNIVELLGPTHDPAVLFPDLPQAEFELLAPRLAPSHYMPGNGRLVIGIQIWVIKLRGDVVIVDTGIGNGKPRGLPRFNRLNTLVPSWLESIGAGPGAVTHVINTHLHGDHVGWNTVGGDNGWAAAFPRAKYWMPRTDYEWWHPRFIQAKGVGETEAFTDAVMPLIEAGKVEFYDEGQEFVPGLRAKAAHGHTPGHMRVDLESDGAVGVFCADIFHSPLQILRPDINTVVDVQQEIARATRLAFLNECATSGALVMPCHFGAPYCVRIVRHGDGFGFVAGND